MKRILLITATVLTALASCKSVRTVYDENGRQVKEHDGARERSLNDYFDEEFDANFSEKRNADGVPEATSKKVSRFQKDIDAARRDDKEYATGTYTAGGSSSYSGKRFSESTTQFSGSKRFDGYSKESAYNSDLRPAFMSEGKGLSRTDNVYGAISSSNRYDAEGNNYDARGKIYATHNNDISTSDTSGYFESRKEKWGKPTIINKGEYYKRTVEETRGLLGRDN